LVNLVATKLKELIKKSGFSPTYPAHKSRNGKLAQGSGGFYFML
jgi:hypothetical protein